MRQWSLVIPLRTFPRLKLRLHFLLAASFDFADESRRVGTPDEIFSISAFGLNVLLICLILSIFPFLVNLGCYIVFAGRPIRSWWFIGPLMDFPVDGRWLRVFGSLVLLLKVIFYWLSIYCCKYAVLGLCIRQHRFLVFGFMIFKLSSHFLNF